MAARMFLAFVKRGRLYRCAETTQVLYSFLLINKTPCAINITIDKQQWRIQDLPVGSGSENLLFWPLFSQKLHEIENNWTEKGACVPSAPSDPLMNSVLDVMLKRILKSHSTYLTTNSILL